MRRLRTTALAAGVAVLAAGAGSAPAATPPAATGATVARCATSPTKLVFARAARAKAGRLAWTAPARPKGAKLAYRVFRNGRRVAQTRTRSARVAVSVRHRYRFSVAVVRNGRVQSARCRAARTLTVRFLPPSRPKRLRISVSGARAVLSWQKSAPGDGRLAGYRVARDGTTVRQLRGTRSTVAVSPDAPQRLTVRAVDSRGNVSAPAAITTASSAQAPQAPEGLRALSVTETGVTLAWNAATAGTARVVGYRVFRDGRALGQVAGTQLSVPRLTTAQAYTFTVVAVDSRGNVSPPSRALTIATDAPPPSTGSLHAFVLASTGSSFEDLKAHYRQIGAIHATYFECNRATAAVQGHDDPRITQFAKLRQVEVYARFDCQSAPVLHTILTDPAMRGAWLATLTNAAVQYGYDGVNLDFEAGAPADRAAYTSFVTELAARLRAIGKKLAVDVSAKTVDDPSHPRSGMYDYPALARAADVVFVMAWGIHWSTSAPGPIADMPWLQAIVRYVDSLPDRAKYVMGSPMYGMDWPRASGTGAPATALEWSEVATLSARVGVPATYDATAHETQFAYTDASGIRHQVWASNAGAVLERMRLFRSNGYGIGVWRLGREDQAMWADPLLAG
jgi:spore germination protein YaaH